MEGISHEDISLLVMDALNIEFDGALDLGIRIFRDQYPKRALHQLVSSQLDVDRIDYLNRDSFYTGVSEGVIGGERIIKMLQIVDDRAGGGGEGDLQHREVHRGAAADVLAGVPAQDRGGLLN